MKGQLLRFLTRFSARKGGIVLWIWVFMALGGRLAVAQCELSGLVVDVTGTGSCSLAVCSPGLPVLELQGNPFSLTPGDQINFSYDTFPGADCGLGLPVSLSCVVVTSSGANGTYCNAQYSWVLADTLDPYKVIFSPFISPPLAIS